MKKKETKASTRATRHDVAAQVAFDRHILKPGLMFEGKSLNPGAFQLWVRGSQRAPPRHLRLHLQHPLPELHQRVSRPQPHRGVAAQNGLRTERFTHRTVYAQNDLRTERFTHRTVYTRTERFTHTQNGLRTERFTNAQNGLHTHRTVYAQNGLHTERFPHRLVHADVRVDQPAHRHQPQRLRAVV
jgi:hypothetical protein